MMKSLLPTRDKETLSHSEILQLNHISFSILKFAKKMTHWIHRVKLFFSILNSSKLNENTFNILFKFLTFFFKKKFTQFFF